MQRPKIAPRYVNIEMKVVMNQDLTAGAKATYTFLKALACGAKEVTFSISEFMALFPVSRATLYRHLNALSQTGTLRHTSFGGRNKGCIHVMFLIDHTKPCYESE